MKVSSSKSGLIRRSRRNTLRPGGQIRLGTLMAIRWVAVLGQLLALVVVEVVLGYDIDLLPAGAVIASSAILNLATAVGHRGSIWLDDQRTALYLGYDILQLSVLLALTGGLNNPFTILILAPVVVSAATLSQRSTAILCGLAVLSISMIGIIHQPLPWSSGGFELPAVFLIGAWISMVMAVVFTATYVSSIALEARRMADALSATQVALSREQRLSALGGLAAAAAHELGSPLGTITVVAREMRDEVPEDLPEDHPLREDIALLQEESDRCRRILAELATRPEDEPAGNEDSPFHYLPMSGLVESVLTNLPKNGVTIDLHILPENKQDQPVVPRSPEVLQSLGTLTRNALEFAKTRVDITLNWDKDSISLVLHDDGPGFDETILNSLGDPYVSTRGRDVRGDGDHMGLGVFISQTLLAHSGAEMTFGNHQDGGAVVEILWDRATFESMR